MRKPGPPGFFLFRARIDRARRHPAVPRSRVNTKRETFDILLEDALGIAPA